MSQESDETRREFLRRLARAAAFVPPALISVSATPAAGQQQKGKGAGKGKAAGKAAPAAQQAAGGKAAPAATALGGTTPAQSTRGNFQIRGSEEGGEPWSPGRTGSEPPWSRPPPTSIGGPN